MSVFSDLVLSIQSLQSYWRFDEESGAPQDSQGTISGSISGTLLQNQPSLLSTVSAGAAISSNGTNQYVEFGDVYDFGGTAEMTVIAFVKPSGTPSSVRGIVAKTDTSDQNGWILRHSSGGVAQFIRNVGGTSDTASLPSALADGENVMLAATYDGATIRLYEYRGRYGLVGTAVAASSQALPGNSAPLYVNRRGQNGNGLIGSLDEIAIFDDALSQGRLTSIYQTARQRETHRLGVPLASPFGVRARTTNRVAITNNGTVETPVTLTLIGPLTDPEITLSYGAGEDRTLVFDGDIVAGDELVISTQDRTIMLNGTVSRRNLLVTAESEWFDLPAGDSTLTLAAASSGDGAGMRVAWRDAYR